MIWNISVNLVSNRVHIPSRYHIKDLNMQFQPVWESGDFIEWKINTFFQSTFGPPSLGRVHLLFRLISGCSSEASPSLYCTVTEMKNLARRFPFLKPWKSCIRLFPVSPDLHLVDISTRNYKRSIGQKCFGSFRFLISCIWIKTLSCPRHWK